ncbi:MAG TPA: YdiU family protein [Acidimicrobiales bacterium]|nr:YdiU family protein [Acidimicrobiales bacterium]
MPGAGPLAGEAVAVVVSCTHRGSGYERRVGGPDPSPQTGRITELQTAATQPSPLFDALTWDDRFVRALPGDARSEVFPRQVPGAAWSPVRPTPVAAPRLRAWSPEVAAPLGLPASPTPDEADEIARVLSGNAVVDGMTPRADRYGGHQFGNWAGQLGDGRAIALGEVVDADGRNQTLQLKGAGPTPYSRSADGRAVLRSSVREFLCSEAMHHLGVPTTRALSLVTTGDQVVRDMFYDGHPAPEPGAVVCRVAPSFTRFGTFELPASLGEEDLLRQLVDHTLAHDFPHLGAPRDDQHRRELLIDLFDEVCRRTASLMVDWMRVGFVHGVMNTDNLSILGLTIDYGPYGWLEPYDEGWTPNTTDKYMKRYRYGTQPMVAQWNLSRLGGAFHVLVGDATMLEASLGSYAATIEQELPRAWLAKLGIEVDGVVAEPDRRLVADLHEVLSSTEIDMTIFFRSLPDVATLDAAATDRSLVEPLLGACYAPDEVTGDVLAGLSGWLRRWRERLDVDDPRARMDAVNPKYVLRNYLAQLAIDAAEQDDDTLIAELHDTLRRPYDDQPGRERFAEKRPEWARERAGCSMLSCSS